jgi:hypothetical protein
VNLFNGEIREGRKFFLTRKYLDEIQGTSREVRGKKI